MKKLIVIPTYWTFVKEVEESVFDHPVPYRKRGTLERCLRHLEELGIEDDIMVFPAPTHNNIERKVNKILSKFSRLNLHMFDEEDLLFIKNLLHTKRFPEAFSKHFNMGHYPNVRNIGFAMAALRKADVVVQIDDDEIVEDPNFVEKALEFIGEKVSKKRLWAKGGYYVNKKGKWKLPQINPHIREQWLKETYINDALKQGIQSKKRLSKITMALGGNMVVHKNVFTKVPYDPFNTRGEDVDYLINCRHFKYSFLFDNQLKVKHIPSRIVVGYWAKLRQDIYRFVYLREKFKYLNLDVSDFDPYPGVFLREDLENRIVATCVNYTKHCMDKRKLHDAKEYLKNATEVLEEAKRRAESVGNAYFEFQKQWKKFMRIL
jgi:hypothetical protein